MKTNSISLTKLLPTSLPPFPLAVYFTFLLPFPLGNSICSSYLSQLRAFCFFFAFSSCFVRETEGFFFAFLSAFLLAFIFASFPLLSTHVFLPHFSPSGREKNKRSKKSGTKFRLIVENET